MAAAIPANAAQKIPDELKGIGITEHLGQPVAIKDLRFNDENGKGVALSDFFRSGKPVLVTLVYYQCPNLCNFMLNGLVTTMKGLDWSAGKDFEIVSISINPHEGPKLAQAKKEAYLRSYGRPEAAQGWHFLTGEESQIQAVASQLGFGYRWDKESQQYAHSAAIFALTPDGKISRYLYGIDFRASDLRLALLEASSGKIGTVIDRLLLFCFRYDPQTRKYSLYLTRVMRAGSAGTVVFFGGYLAVFWRRQRREKGV
ncbi:MAG: SCO family protein [Bdellovibrionota bacterium]